MRKLSMFNSTITSFLPRQYQLDAVDSVFDYFRTKKGHPCIAMPTGTGKSIVIGGILTRALHSWPSTRALVLTHVKQLIEQNYDKLNLIWPTAPAGIYSTGLRQWDTSLPIIFGGVASVKNSPQLLASWFDFVIIDEGHLLSPDSTTMYRFIISELMKRNPKLKIILLTATPYRLKQGMITEGPDALCTDICFDLTSFEEFNKLVYAGYISPIIPIQTDTHLSTDGVKIVGGDYNQKQAQSSADKPSLNYKIISEMVKYASDRNVWLVFASGIAHCDHMAATLNRFGITALAAHSGFDNKALADQHIAAYKRGDAQCLVTYNMFTTGQDHPPIDFIGMVRLTESPGLNVQMWGRGTRPSPETGKINCLGMDFARNTQRLGPINGPRIPQAKGKGTGELPVKICEQRGDSGIKCNAYNHPRAVTCIKCGKPFEFENKLASKASTLPIMKTETPIIEWRYVTLIQYTKYEKNGFAMLRVHYYCGADKYHEFVHLERPGGQILNKAHDWWRARHASEPPATVDAALSAVSQLRQPKRIKVHINLTYPEILACEW